MWRSSKVTLVVPDPLRDYLTTAPVYVSKSGAPVPAQRDLPSTIRHAIRAARKMRIAYQDGDGRSTERVIQPFAVAYYTGATLICAWCELRNDVGQPALDALSLGVHGRDATAISPFTIAPKEGNPRESCR
jgi:predicted DNA-binding transcriptional regulator YafY